MKVLWWLNAPELPVPILSSDGQYGAIHALSRKVCAYDEYDTERDRGFVWRSGHGGHNGLPWTWCGGNLFSLLFFFFLHLSFFFLNFIFNGLVSGRKMGLLGMHVYQRHHECIRHGLMARSRDDTLDMDYDSGYWGQWHCLGVLLNKMSLLKL